MINILVRISELTGSFTIIPVINSINLRGFWGPEQRRRYSGSLQAERFGVRNPVKERDFLFSTPVWTGTGADSASCTQ